jgi:CheY-like chemotaxis protein
MNDLTGKTILVVEGSLLSSAELKQALEDAGAAVCVTTNLISAFNLLARMRFDGAVIDQALHNEAFDLCTELRCLDTPYVCCNSPHRLQGSATRQAAAHKAVEKLSRLMLAASEPEVEEGVLLEFLKQRKGKSGGGFGEPQHDR